MNNTNKECEVCRDIGDLQSIKKDNERYNRTASTDSYKDIEVRQRADKIIIGCIGMINTLKKDCTCE